MPGTENARAYLLQKDDDDNSEDNHSSFKCNNCGKILPVKTLKPPTIRLPKGFKKNTVEIIETGLCKILRHMKKLLLRMVVSLKSLYLQQGNKN